MMARRGVLALVLVASPLLGSCAVADGVFDLYQGEISASPELTVPGNWSIDGGGAVIFYENGTGEGNGGLFLGDLQQSSSGCARVASWRFIWEVEYDEDAAEFELKMEADAVELERWGRMGCLVLAYSRTVTMSEVTTNRITLNAGQPDEEDLYRFVFRGFEGDVISEALTFYPRDIDIELANVGHTLRSGEPQVLAVEGDALPAQVSVVSRAAQSAPRRTWKLLPEWYVDDRWQGSVWSFLQLQLTSFGRPTSIEGSDGSAPAALVRVEQEYYTGMKWVLVYEGRCDALGLDCPIEFGGPTALTFRLKTQFTGDTGSLTHVLESGELRSRNDEDDHDQLWFVRPM